MITARPHALVSSDVTRNMFTTNGGLIMVAHLDVFVVIMTQQLATLTSVLFKGCLYTAIRSTTLSLPSYILLLLVVFLRHSTRETANHLQL